MTRRQIITLIILTVIFFVDGQFEYENLYRLTHYSVRDYFSLTDMANAKESESSAENIIKNWIRNRHFLEFWGTWEQINTPNFKMVKFDHFKF